MADPPHILHVCNSFNPGGAEVRTARLIDHFADRYRHSILPLTGGTGAAAMMRDPDRVQWLEPPPRAGSWRTTRAMLRLYREHKPDLVLSYGWGSFDAVFATSFSRKRPHIHHEDGMTVVEATTPCRRRHIMRSMFLPRMNGLIVPSTMLRDRATSRWRMRENLVHWIPNGVESVELDPASGAQLRQDLDIPPDAHVVSMVGRLAKEKAIDRALRAIADRPIHLLLAGDGEEEAGLRALATELGIADRVHFFGRLENTLPVRMASNLHLSTSTTEQHPLTLVEAMAAAHPVVATDVGDVRVTLPDAQHPFVVAADASTADLTKAIDAMFADENRRKELGQLNRQHQRNHFTFDGMAARHAALIDGALGASAPPPFVATN